MQSSAYVPECEHFNLSHRSSLARRSASRYLSPNFSSSAMEHSVTTGTHLAYNRSIRPGSTSILERTVCEKKFVSRRTWYGGPSAWFAWKNMAEGAWGMWHTAARSASSCCCCLLAAGGFACSRLSRALRTRFTWNLRQLEAVFFLRRCVEWSRTWANFLVFLTLPILICWRGVGSEE